MTSDIVDKIYEAAALPKLWPDLFQEMADAHDFVGAGMFTMNAQFQRGVSSESIAEAFDLFINGGWGDRNPRAPRVAAKRYPGFLRDQDILTDEEIATHPMYVELLRPHGLGYGAGSIVQCPNGDMVALSFERAHALGPTPVETLGRLDELRPHLARAAVFSARLDLERSQAQVAALAAIGLPAAVASNDGRALAVNDAFVSLAPHVEIGARDMVSLRNPGGQKLLSATLGRRPDALNAGCSIPLKALDGAAPLVFHVLPVRRAARDVFSKAAWLLIGTPLGSGAAPSAAILGGLFDLSPAEARVARGLIEGRTVTEVADGHRLSESTVRNQLRSIFAKTGVSRQSELILLCGGIGAPSA